MSKDGAKDILKHIMSVMKQIIYILIMDEYFWVIFKKLEECDS